MLPSLLPLALASLLPGVETVDDTPGGGAEFATIQAAIDAAADGDTVLVAGGTYDAFVVDGKDVAITYHGSPVAVQGTSIVRNLPAGKQVLLRRLYLEGHDGEALRVEDVQGTVWIEECSLVASDTSGTFGKGAPGLSIDGAADVRVIRTLVQGEQGSHEWTTGSRAQAGGPGILARSAVLSVFDTSATGGNGGSATFKGYLDGGDAGDGVALEASWLRAWGSTLRGGEGGYGDFCESCPGGTFCGIPGTGGDALSLTAQPGPASVELTSIVLVPGEAGVTGDPSRCADGDPGSTTSGDGPGDIVIEGGPHRAFWTPSPVVDGGPVAIFLKGEPGDLALIALGSSAQPLQLAGVVGPLFLGADLKLVFSGPWSPASLEPLLGAIPPQAPGFETARLFVQGAVVTSSGEPRLLAPASIVVVDDGF